MINWVIDIETLGTRLDSVILEVAIYSKGHSGHWALNTYEQATKFGRRIDPKTIHWWHQPERVKDYNQIMAHRSPTKVAEFLAEFTQFFKLAVQSEDKIWTRHPTFDIGILTHLYESQDVPVPWSHRQIRDTATLELLSIPNTPHRAMEDAKLQYNQLEEHLAIFKALDE